MPGGIPAPVVTPTAELINPTTKIRLQCSVDDVDIYYTVAIALNMPLAELMHLV